jgi:signal transduction histidine kinase
LQEDHEAPSASLVTRLRSLTEEFIASDVRVELVLSEIVDLEPQEPIREALAGAIREALNNVAKHSGAQHAVVRATPFKGGIQVTIRDHGRGFVSNTYTDGVGLRGSVIERMQRVNGAAEVWSQPGGGTRVTLWAPLSSASE